MGSPNGHGRTAVARLARVLAGVAALAVGEPHARAQGAPPSVLPAPPPPLVAGAGAGASAPETSGFTPSLYYALSPGIAGKLSNPIPGHAVGLDVEVPLAKYVNYHLVLGLATAAGYYGFQLKPLVFGFPIPVGKSRLGRWLIEPCIDPIAAEGLANAGSSLFLSAGMWVQGVLKADGYSVSLAPIGFTARYWSVYGNSEDATSGFGGGVNWLTRLTVGL